jgi:hypothetical protein
MRHRKVLLLTAGAFALLAYAPAGASAADLDCADFASNHRNVQRVSFKGCGRRSRHKVTCRFVLRGSRGASCRLRVAVRGEGDSLSRVRIARVRCRR